MFSATEPVEVWRAPTLTNAYTSRPDWAQAVKVWAGLGDVQPNRTLDPPSPDRDRTQEWVTAFLPHGAPVETGDRVRARNLFYEVDGEPEQWGRTSRRHVRVSAWRWVT